MNTNNGGITNIDVLSVGALYVGGKRFRDIIKSLMAEDALEQQEIEDLRNLLTYLNTTALNQPWIINNDNRNAVLKTAIDLINTRLQYLNTTSLSESWLINNDNRNAILKTRIDGHDGDLTTLNTKTQYQSSVIGSNTEPRTASTFNVTIGDREKRQLYLTSGANFISSINDSTNQATAGNYTDNKIELVSQNGMISSIAHLNRLQGIDKIEITGFGGMGIQSSPNIIIGNKGAQIKIGSEDTPEIGSTNTIIQIGKRTITRNTETRLQGNIKIVEARFDELTVSSALTWQQFLSLISPTGIPAWVASAILTSVIPNYVFSDLWSMKGQITKDGDVETINKPKLKGYTVYDNTIDIDILPKVQTFIAKGDISETTLLGSIRQQVFNGEILLRNNNILATNIDWALTEAGDKCNYIKLSNNDVEIIAGAGANNSQLRISNTTTGGKIKFRMGSGGLQSNAHDALSIFNDQATSQILVSNSNAPSGYDTTSKMLLDHNQLTNGLKVTNGSNALITRVNHNNINTPSLTLLSNWTGTTANTLYLNANNQLQFNGAPVGGLTGAQGAGAIFILNNPTNETNQNPELTMTTTYTSTLNKFIRRETFNHSTVYPMGKFKSPYIDYNSNVILQGTYEANLYGLLFSNQASSIFCKLYHVSERTVSSDFIVDKSTLYAGNNNQTTYFSMKTKPFIIPANEANFTIYSVIFPAITILPFVGGGEPLTLRLTLRDNLGTVLGTATNINFSAATITQDFSFLHNQVVSISGTTTIQFQVDLIDTTFGGAQFRQPTSRSQTDMNYKLQGIFKNCIYNGNSDRTTLTFNQVQQYSILIPMPADSYDISEFTQYNKIQLEPFFIQTGTGSTTGHSFSLYTGDSTLSHLHTSINLSAASATIPTLAQIMNNDLVALGAPYFVNATRATQHLDMNSKTIYNATVDGYSVKALTAGTNISITSSSGNFTINAALTPDRRGFRYYNGGTAWPKINFNIGSSVNLINKRIVGTLTANLVAGNVDYPLLIFNNLHVFPSSSSANSTGETSVLHFVASDNPMGNNIKVIESLVQNNQNITRIGNAYDNYGSGNYMQVNFEITYIINRGQTILRQLVCNGTSIISSKPIGTAAWQHVHSSFCRTSDLAGSSSLTHIGLSTYTQFSSTSGIREMSMDIEVFDLPSSYTLQTVS